jgi:hypothetical protein
VNQPVEHLRSRVPSVWHWIGPIVLATAIVVAPISFFRGVDKWVLLCVTSGLWMAKLTRHPARTFLRVALVGIIAVPTIRIAEYEMAYWWGFREGADIARERLADGSGHRFKRAIQGTGPCMIYDPLDISLGKSRGWHSGVSSVLPSPIGDPSEAWRILSEAGAEVVKARSQVTRYFVDEWNLTDPRITDNEVEWLLATRAEYVRIGSPNVTAACLKTLRHHRGIKELNLEGTQITVADLKEFYRWREKQQEMEPVITRLRGWTLIAGSADCLVADE